MGPPLPAPPTLMQEVEPVRTVKELGGQARQAEGEVADRAVLAVLSGHGAGTLEPAGQKEPPGHALAHWVAPAAGL